jgi:carbon monoxide dehydrogenase subunit G
MEFKRALIGGLPHPAHSVKINAGRTRHSADRDGRQESKMLEHQLPISIAASKAAVWSYVSDMANWASNFPGYRSFEVISQTDSGWTLKVGVGALVRTVKVKVHVELWSEPDRVEFTFRLDAEPVDGSGSYVATLRQDGGTNIVLTVRINGQGAMAPAWEAMARTVLPKLVKGFGESLKMEIEQRTAVTLENGEPRNSVQHTEAGWLRRIWRSLARLFPSAARNHSR